MNLGIEGQLTNPPDIPISLERSVAIKRVPELTDEVNAALVDGRLFDYCSSATKTGVDSQALYLALLGSVGRVRSEVLKTEFGDIRVHMEGVNYANGKPVEGEKLAAANKLASDIADFYFFLGIANPYQEQLK